jgi:hypothetical protein
MAVLCDGIGLVWGRLSAAAREERLNGKRMSCSLDESRRALCAFSKPLFLIMQTEHNACRHPNILFTGIV